MMKIVFLDGHTLNPGDLSWDRLKALGDFQAYDRTETKEELYHRAADAEVLIVNKTLLTETDFDHLPRLQLVCVAATGYDVVDVEAARRRGIPVCNAAGYGSRAVAQMATALLLEATTRAGHYAQANRQGFWTNSRDFCCWNNPLIELADKHACIVGYGNIGRHLADILRALGMKLHAVSSKPQEELPPDVQKITLEEAFSTCHVVSLNCPLTPSNREMVNATLLAKANPNLILINTARGRLIDEKAVAQALWENRLAAYCCDVLSHEPPAADNPILTAPRTIVTPHVAWATVEARERIIDILASNIKAYTEGKIQNVVNA